LLLIQPTDTWQRLEAGKPSLPATGRELTMFVNQSKAGYCITNGHHVILRGVEYNDYCGLFLGVGICSNSITVKLMLNIAVAIVCVY